ncbi:SDR family NAD(P)-dependent oxidoreductase [Catenulispora sp. GAS73]|uniref:type I polyketide synthase n=1 Tax=Catenulispora sp. GAS73 TaxID=3156269 RepID=UPI0035181AA2
MTDTLDQGAEAAGTDIAIVGMSGRFPGAGSVSELWDAIRAGRSGVTRFTDGELLAAGVPRALLADPAYVKAGAVIDGYDLFDAGFFGYGPKDAQILDPQQRLFLEHSWHALEDAGCDPSRFDGAIGVFGGSAFSTYLQNNLGPSGTAAALGDLVVGLANDKDSLTTRVAHNLDLTGPSYSVQSYCSTSLVAVCAAASSLSAFECDLALAGGVNVAVPQRVGYLYQPGGIAPPDAETRAFDAAGLGAPVGSGVGVVAVRRLEDALADGDRVYAVIRGWAVNNDGGRKVGFTAPGVRGQAAVIAEALSVAGLAPADIDYVEAHGTGTALGDASEIAALQQVFSGESLLIGSIKTNVGHLDRAAGVTGLIKAVLALRSGEIPPTRNLTDPNPQLAAGAAKLDVVTRLTDWPDRDGRPRRAGVSAFGIGGTNAHTVLEQAPVTARPEPSPRPELLVWSGRSAAAAEAMTEQLAEHLASPAGAGDRLSDIAHTLQSGRRVFEHRRILVASSIHDAVTGIRDAQVLVRAETRTDREVGFLIAGTGEQYPGMAADLYAAEPVFREALEQCRAVLIERLGGVDPLQEMLSARESGEAAGLARMLGREAVEESHRDGAATDRLQPAVFAVEYALARLLMAWGIQPSVMIGYSLGEYVAACLAGVVSLGDALALVARRAQLINTLPTGSMAAVPLPVADVRVHLERSEIEAVDVAAVNGREVTVVAGPPEAIDRFRAFLETGSVPVRPLATSHAFHSRMLEPVKDELTAWIGQHIRLSEPQIPYISGVTGQLATADQVTDPGYWAEHMCRPVLFDEGLKTLIATGDPALLEIGPGPSLGAMARGHRDLPRDRWSLVVATLPSAADPREASTVLAEAVGRLWLAGVPIDWDGYQAGRPVAKTGLPGYAFQRERYWIDAPREQEPATPEAHVRLMRPEWISQAATGAAVTLGRCRVLGDTVGLAQALTGAGAAVVADGTADTVIDLRLLTEPGDDPVSAFAKLADQLGSEGAGSTTRLVIVTRGGQAVLGEDRPVPEQAAADALPVVANQEYLNLECRAVDLDPRGSAEDVAQALTAEISQSSQDILVAYRGGRRYVRTFAPIEFSAEPAPEPDSADTASAATAIRSGGTYLITGGVGDVGLLIAEHLARQGAARLILTSRSGREPESLARVRDLGAEVVVAAVDVTDTDAMRELLTTAGRVDGIIHAAAQTAQDTFRPLRYADPASVAVHFGAKVRGAQALAAILAELPEDQAPDFCLLFSSTSSVLGGLAFGSYAAANAALTAIGHRPDSASTRWITACWDTWAPTLARLGGPVGETMTRHAMTERQALAAFDALLAPDRPAEHAAILVVAGGLDDRLPRVAAPADDLVPLPPPTPVGERFPRPELPQPYSPPITDTERALAEVWSDCLGVEPVGTRDNFFDLSGTSLLALQMLTMVKQRFGVTLPSVILFEAPTVHDLAAMLDEKGAALTPGAQAPEPARPAVPMVPAVPAVQRTGTEIDHQIAVVGMSGRFPGADDVATFWQNIRDGVESISFFDEAELLASGVTPDLIADDHYVPARPVLADVTGFDAAFFGLSPRMAALTDPQQRLFLEVCWEALENAGYAAPEHRGRVGVFGGSNISTYLLRMPEETLLGGDVSTYEIIMGNDKDALTTNVSYLFDLRGPSVAVQTFCSTSLVAAHMAMQSLRTGECDLAMAGGVSIRVPDKVGHIFGPGGMESPDGHVRTFDAQARGSMFGDGAAVVVLKRLADALRDGDHIWSVIRGSAMNNDGALKVGYTAPSVVGQARVVADALADAGITGEDVSYIEAHGTATELGDPIEMAALTRAFGPTRTRQYCPIGSVKTNVGHLDRAAGVTGLIKTSLALRDRVIPPSLHYTSPNPEIDFENSPFYVNTALSPWRTRDGRPAIAGINSLGMGGTNVHVVVQEAPRRDTGPGAERESGRRFQVLPLSTRNAAAADQSATRLAEHLAGPGSGHDLADVAYTLQIGRKTFEHRRVAVAETVESAAKVLGGSSPGLMSRVDAVRGRQVAFLFTGTGEQYPGLVAELYRREPVFRDELDECLRTLREALPNVDLTDLLAGPRVSGGGLAALLGRDESAPDDRTSALEDTAALQPALFAVEYALARTLMAWGVRPRLMLGYSLGEYVAACLSGVLSVPDALALVIHRAKLIAALPHGAMAAVSVSAAELADRYDLSSRNLDIAALNGSEITVVSGPAPDVEDFVSELRAAEIACRTLQTTHAFHSRMLDGAAADLTAWIGSNVTLNAPKTPYISNVTGEIADAGLVCDPAYWARHMTGTVQFAAGIQNLLADPELAIVEIGPGTSLGALIRGAGGDPKRWPLIVGTLPAAADSRPDDAVLADCLARLWLLGVDVDWPAFHGRSEQIGASEHADGRPDERLPGRVPLPTYPFQRQRYWISGRGGGESERHRAGEFTAGQAPDASNLFEAVASLPKLPEEQWLHVPVWRQTAMPARGPAPASRLVFTRDGAADDVARRLGPDAVMVRPGRQFAVLDDGFTVRPGSLEDAVSLLRALKQPLDQVVHLWNLEPVARADAGAHGLHTLVALARAAGEFGMDSWSLDVGVSGTQQVLRGDVTDPDAATLMGPCLVIPLEFPKVTARLIDVDEPADLPAELGRARTDRIVALRRGRRWIPGYETMAVDESAVEQGSGLRDGGVYLITGGLGGVALGLAERLVRDREAKLVLLARHGLPPREQWHSDTLNSTDRQRVQRVEALLALGAEIEVVTGDVTKPDDVRKAVDTAVERFGAVHGILHAAGVPGMGLMQFKHPAELDQVTAPKIDGARAITEALGVGTDGEIKLDFVVYFSSITSATGGGPGQVDYCAANAFLDSYAGELAATGRRVVSIDWGEWTWNAWEQGLDGYDEKLQTFFRENRARFGIGFDDGWRSLQRALAAGEPRVVVSTQDFPLVVMGSAQFTIEAVMPSRRQSGERYPRPELVTSYQEPSGEDEAKIAEIWRDALRLELVGVQDNFFELGGNSLLGVSIVAAMRKEFGLAEMPPHILYEAPTVAALALVVESAAAGTPSWSSSGPEDDGNQVRAQLRRSGLEASASRRRATAEASAADPRPTDN